MNLLIDQGNTSTKYVVIQGEDIVAERTLANIDFDVLKELTANFEIKNTLVSSVREEYNKASAELKNILGESIFFFDDSLSLPVNNLYTTPKTLGRDRMAGVCGAATLFPNTNCLVIDAGTCITYDFIDAKKNYHGGSISPGIEMRFKAMNTFTGKLPLAPLEWVDDFIGNSTQTALQTGVTYGVVNEINGFINRYIHRWGNITTIMCGGNTDFLAKRCESEIFAAPKLVTIGLNQILKHNLAHGA